MTKRHAAAIVAAILTTFCQGCRSDLVIDPWTGAVYWQPKLRPAPGSVSGSTFADQYAFAQKLRAVSVTVRVDAAKIIRDNGRDGEIELTISIEGAPRYLPYFELATASFDDKQIFVNRGAASSGGSALLRVERTDTGWRFYDYFSKAPMPSQHDTVTVRVQFLRVKAASTQLPQEVWFQLAVRNRGEGVYGCDVVFFYGRVPLPLETSS